LKHVGVVLLLVAAPIIAAGCGGGDQSWRTEFDARLTGASAEIEEKLGDLTPGSTESAMFRATEELAGELDTEAELVESLDPPDACEEVQEEGMRKLTGTAQFSAELLKNLTPYLRRRLPGPFRERIAEYKLLEHEAARCESG
jgi:hypothetical protein